jgi:hypothetical protein
MSSILNTGLSVNDVVSVNVSLAPTAAQQRNFGSLLILGDSPVIDSVSRMRSYSGLAGVASDFGTTAPEYLAASLFFGQTPQPQQLYIGLWARTAQAGRLIGAVRGSAQQVLSLFTAVVAGTLNVTIDGTVHPLAAINLSAATSLSQVAGILTTALGASGIVTWDSANAQFNLTSATTGATSSVSFSTTAPSPDIGGLLGFQALQGGFVAPGIIAETAAACAALFAALSGAWYGLMFAASVMPATADYVAVAALIAGLTTSHILGVTTQDATVFNAGSSADVASQLAQGRSFVQFSSSSPYAVAAVFGIAFTVNFNGIGTAITLKFKVEGGLQPEVLTESQAATCAAKNCNVFVQYNNNTAILQQGVMSNGYFFDVVQGTDWLQNAIQTALFNVLFTSGKVPQTDPGMTRLVATVSQVLDISVNNGLVAAGVWTGPPIGVIVTGQTLSAGYYVFAGPVAAQLQADRAARKATVITAAIKLAGAIHSASVLLNVNQ